MKRTFLALTVAFLMIPAGTVLAGQEAPVKEIKPAEANTGIPTFPFRSLQPTKRDPKVPTFLPKDYRGPTQAFRMDGVT